MSLITKTINAPTGEFQTGWGIQKFDKLTTYELDSAFDLLSEEVPESNQPEWKYKLAMRRDTAWYGGGLRWGAEVLKAVEEVDPCLHEETLKKVKHLQAPMYNKAVTRETKRRRKRFKGDFGNELDIHEVRQGRTDRAWTRTKFVNRNVHGNKHVMIILNASMNCSITAAQAQWRSAALIAVHDALVKMGKSVSISFMWSNSGVFAGPSGNGELTFFYAPLKESSSYMSQEHLATYTSTAFIRLLTLSKFFNLPGRRVTGGYGCALSQYKYLPYPAQKMREAGQHVVIVGQCYSKEAAKEVMEKVIKQVEDADAVPAVDRHLIGDRNV